MHQTSGDAAVTFPPHPNGIILSGSARNLRCRELGTVFVGNWAFFLSAFQESLAVNILLSPTKE